jgi:hydrophobic/amphiphilic exporter-1 (mainly G- bacteria), HAE1 family
MKKLVQFAVHYPVTISMIILGILLLGFISLRKLSVDLLPEINAPRIFVEFKSGERPPEEIERQFVEGMESLIIRLKGVSQVYSNCMVGAARIKVEYNWGTDMDDAFLDLQKALSTYGQNQDIQDFVITQHDPNASPVMLYAMVNPEITDMNEMRKTGENIVRNELIRLEGVAEVTVSGAEEKEIVIETDPYRLAAFGLTTDNLVQQVMSMNRSVSGGSIVEMGKRYTIKGTSLIASQSDLDNLVVAYRQSSGLPTATAASSPAADRVPVFLKDVGKVSFSNKEPDNIVRVNGKRCVGLAVYKETSYNTVKAVEEITRAMHSIETSLPGYQFIEIQNQGTFISDAIRELRNAALIGAFFAVIVLFLFLRKTGLTLIITFVLPVSVVATFVLMYFNHLTLNVMTLGGLALGAGMLVDNAIVIVENIFRNLELGKTVKEASITGTTEVGGAIISSTITTVVVFLPIVYLHGASGTLFKDQAWTVAFSQLASLFIAIIVIPMLFHWIYKDKPQAPVTQALRFNWYGRFLSKVLDRRRLVISMAALILAITALVLPHVGNEFIPQGETGDFSLDIKLSEGTQLMRTAGMVENMEAMLKEILGDKADIIYSQIGPFESSNSEKAVFQNQNTASIKIRLKPSAVHESAAFIRQISQLSDSIPDAEISIVRNESSLESTLGTDESPLEIRVSGRDLQLLDSLTAEIKQRLSAVPGIYNLKTSIEKGAPEMDVVIDRYMASYYNLTSDGITNQVKDILMGKQAGKFDNNGELNDITVRLPKLTLTEFNSIILKSGNRDIPLSEVAQFKMNVSPKELLRINQNRIGTVTGDIDRTLAFDKVIGQVRKTVSNIPLPNEYDIKVSGEEEKRKDAMSNLGFALLLSVILVYMVMAAQFESLIHPFTVLLTIPLAGAGSILTFFLLGKSLNIMAYIGIIMLGGIAVNNSILLVDAINQFREQGLDLRKAIIQAGQNRIRPILMTSLTSILGLVPMTLGIGESASLRSPMAVALISGLTASTVMSLVVIPCVYYIFDRSKDKPLTR